MRQARNGRSEYVKLEERLVLLAWLNSLFGYERNRDLLADLKEAAEGFDASGRSFVYHRLEARGDKVKVSLADLARYDDNIREHLRAMNAPRPEPITLRYFQHIAVLYTEIFLDWYFHRRGEMLRSLNRFVDERLPAALRTAQAGNASKTAADPKDLSACNAQAGGMMRPINFHEPDLADGVVSPEELFCQVSRDFSPLLLGFFRQCATWHGAIAG